MKASMNPLHCLPLKVIAAPFAWTIYMSGMVLNWTAASTRTIHFVSLRKANALQNVLSAAEHSKQLRASQKTTAIVSGTCNVKKFLVKMKPV